MWASFTFTLFYTKCIPFSSQAASKAKYKSYKELYARMQRDEKLKTLQEKLEIKLQLKVRYTYRINLYTKTTVSQKPNDLSIRQRHYFKIYSFITFVPVKFYEHLVTCVFIFECVFVCISLFHFVFLDFLNYMTMYQLVKFISVVNDYSSNYGVSYLLFDTDLHENVKRNDPLVHFQLSANLAKI